MNSNTIDAELKNCSFIKTVLMLCVVLGHSFCFWGGEWFTNNPAVIVKTLIVFADWLNTFHIYCFTLISGYIFYHIKYEKGGYNKYIPFLLNKAKRLLIPFVFVAVVWVIPITLFFFDDGIKKIFVNYFLAISPSQLWFLFMLFTLFAIFYPLSDVIQKHVVLGAAIVGAFYCFSIVGGLLIPNVFQILRACAYMPFFWLGFVIRQYGSGIIRRIPAILWLFLHIVLFFISMYVKELDGFVFKVVDIGLSFTVNIAGALMAFVVLQRVAELVNWQNSKLFGCLTLNSMPVYLFHQQIIYFIIYYFNGVINPYIHALLNFVISLAVSLLISHILMRFKVTKFLIGQK